jgi:two-component system sensor histidine kinase and response regulator WspE
MSSDDDLSHLSLLELFSEEAKTQARVLTDGLLALERAPDDPAQLEACMRAAHSLKGAARIVGLQAGVDVAHAMEDCFVSAQGGQFVLDARHIDELLRGVDLLVRLGGDAGVQRAEVEGFVDALERVVAGESAPLRTAALVTDILLHAVIELVEPPLQVVEPAVVEGPPELPRRAPGASVAKDADRVLRVTAEHLNRLLSLSGEVLVESRWLKPFAESMLRMKRVQRNASRSLDVLQDALTDGELNQRSYVAIYVLRQLM